MASDVKIASGSLTANGQTVAELSYANGALSLFVAGTFTGTIHLSALPNTVAGDTTVAPVTPLGMTTPDITKAGVYVFPFTAGDFNYSVQSVATWTGTANVVLSAAPRS